MRSSDIRYAQALGYVWGRQDMGERPEGLTSDLFADFYASNSAEYTGPLAEAYETYAMQQGVKVRTLKDILSPTTTTKGA